MLLLQNGVDRNFSLPNMCECASMTDRHAPIYAHTLAHSHSLKMQKKLFVFCLSIVQRMIEIHHPRIFHYLASRINIENVTTTTTNCCYENWKCLLFANRLSHRSLNGTVVYFLVLLLTKLCIPSTDIRMVVTLLLRFHVIGNIGRAYGLR